MNNIFNVKENKGLGREFETPEWNQITFEAKLI